MLISGRGLLPTASCHKQVAVVVESIICIDQETEQ